MRLITPSDFDVGGWDLLAKAFGVGRSAFGVFCLADRR
jgi:hypothetical protein